MTHDDLALKPDLLHDQRVLITGGGTGLGRVMAEAALLLGAEVHICGRRKPVLDETCKELQDAHAGTIVPHMCDLRVDTAITEMLDTIWRDHGPLTALVNNAAGNFISRTEDLSPRAFDAVTSTVQRGAFCITVDCGRRWLKEGRKGSVLSIVTTWVWNGSPFTVPSAMAKSAVNAMTQSLAVEWGNRGIRFNAIAPGLFPTEGMSARLTPGASPNPIAGNPMQRAGRMPELANLAMFLLSPQSEYLNGQTIAIDGGQFQATGGNFSTLSDWTDEQWLNARRSNDERNRADRSRRSE